VIQGLHGCCY